MRPSRALLVLLAATAVSASQHSLQSRSDRPAHLAARQLFGFGDDAADSATSSRGGRTATAGPTSSADGAAAAASSSSAAEASAESASSASAASASAAAASASASASRAAAASSSSAADASASSAAAASESAAEASASAAASRSSAAEATSTSERDTTSATARASLSTSLSTDSAGLTITQFATVEATDLPETTSALPTASIVAAASDNSGGSHTALIIGVSVAGGAVLIAAAIFLFIKFGPKRKNYEDGDADIKWPELKTDPDSNVMQPLPARRTGGAGFDMGDDSDNEGHDGFEKGRGSFSGSTTGLANTAAGGAYGMADYPPMSEQGYSMHHHTESLDQTYSMHHQPVDAQYYDQNMAYGQQQHHQYPMHMQQNAAYPDSNSYGPDPYAHPGMHEQHPSGPYYQHNY